MSEERLNKSLAALGLGSRRQIDQWIGAGRIAINGQTARLGQKVTTKDTITLDGRALTRRPLEKTLIAFHKPRGVTTTKKDRFAKVTVMDYLPPHLQHLHPIGRLDRASRGLLLLTNDGDLAKRLTHPSYEHQKEYEVVVKPSGEISEAVFRTTIDRLADEVIDPDIQTKPPKVLHVQYNEAKQLGQVTLILTEGKKRQIRRLFAALGYDVVDLLRTRIDNINLAGLGEGEYVVINSPNV